MGWVVIGIVLSVLATTVLAIALARASRRLREVERETRALVELGSVESPSGKPFFATSEAVWEIAGVLEDRGLSPAGSVARHERRPGHTRPRLPSR